MWGLWWGPDDEVKVGLGNEITVNGKSLRQGGFGGACLVKFRGEPNMFLFLFFIFLSNSKER
jgi:hypothetical protein